MAVLRSARKNAVHITIAMVAAAGVPATTTAQEDGGRVAAISDFHLDPFATEGLVQRLISAAPGRPVDLGGLPSGAFALYGSDTNLPLFQASLSAFAAQGTASNVVIFLGDTLSHGFEEAAATALGVPLDDDRIGELAARTTVFVIDRVRETAGDVPVVFALGNNDAACGDYMITPGGRYLERTAESVRAAAGAEHLDATFDDTWRRGGYYAMRHPTRADLRILSINSVLWSAKYENRCGDGDAGAGQLAWLTAQLAEAEQQGEKVWLVTHIPVGVDAFASRRLDRSCGAGAPVTFLRPEYETGVVSLLARYAEAIAAVFYGHTHRDSYRLIGPGDGRTATAPWPAADGGGEPGAPLIAKIVPSISPIYDNNPGFQVLAYDADGRITDFETYSIDLASEHDRPDAPWRREYGFRDTYGEAFSAAAVGSLMEDVRAAPSGPRAETFSRLYPLGHQPPSGDYLRSIACAIDDPDAEDFEACFCGTGSAATDAATPDTAPTGDAR